MKGLEPRVVMCALIALSACVGSEATNDDGGTRMNFPEARHRRDTMSLLSGDRNSREGRTYSVEFRSYNLKPGTRAEFDRLVVEEGLPMLRRWTVDVVAYGPSLHDQTSYFLVRAYDSLEERERIEDAFYSSTEWREGPREAVLALIDSYTTIVLQLDRAAVDALRMNLGR